MKPSGGHVWGQAKIVERKAPRSGLRMLRKALAHLVTHFPPNAAIRAASTCVFIALCTPHSPVATRVVLTLSKMASAAGQRAAGKQAEQNIGAVLRDDPEFYDSGDAGVSCFEQSFHAQFYSVCVTLPLQSFRP